MGNSIAPGVKQLQHLIQGMTGWLPVVQRATNAQAIRLCVHADNTFDVITSWPSGSYTRRFTKEFLFGRSFACGPTVWRLEKKACQYARELIQEILQQRGVM